MKAAFGKVRITPEEPVFLQGYASRTGMADPRGDVLDELYARLALLDDGRRRVLIVGADCCLTNEEKTVVFFPNRPGEFREFPPTIPPGSRKRWAIAAEAEESAVFLNATHTHSAPVSVDPRHVAAIEREIAGMKMRLEPVRLFLAEGDSGVSSWRRPNLRPNPAKRIDRAVRTLICERTDGAPVGAIVNFAVHPTLLTPTSCKISSEFVGLAMAELERRQGGEFVSVFVQGFSGDVCPVHGYSDGDGYAMARKAAAELAADILAAWQRRRETESDPLGYGRRTFAARTREGFGRPDVPVELSVFAVGSAFGLLGIAAEVFNDYAALLSEYAPWPAMMWAGLTNGTVGYIPTAAAFRDSLGGYEMLTTPFDETAEPALIAAARELFEELRRKMRHDES